VIELRFCVAKLGRFGGSTGSVGFGEKEKEDALPFEVFEGELFAFVRVQAERGRFVAYFEHEAGVLFAES
jgi:hypothetical protein